MNELQEIYETLVDLGFCKSQAEYSRHWLGRSGGYFAYTKSSKAPVALSAIGMLIGRLESISPTLDDSRWHQERRRIRAALIAAKVMFQGEFELRFVPPWARVTAVW